MLKVENLTLMKKKIAILSRIHCEISAGRTTLLLGKSGSGKTSLLRCLAQLETGYEGEITYAGRSIREHVSKERCRLMGFVPQSYALFPHMNVLDNCIHPQWTVLRLSQKEAREKALEMAAVLDIGNLISSYPHELSGGQQQRAAIARALLLDPHFLLLDEPTSALDPENTDRLIELLKKLRGEGRGIVIASQDMVFASKIFDRALYLEEGHLLEAADDKNSIGDKLMRFLF